MTFSKSAVIDINPSLEVTHICNFIQKMTFKNFKHKGAVIGLSGGIDSSVVAELLRSCSWERESPGHSPP